MNMLNMRKCLRLAGLFLACALPAHAQIAPGDYVTEGGWGNLSLKPGAGGLAFQINAIGANLHVCEIAGVVRAGVARVETDEKGKACVVRFTPKFGGIEVSPQEGEPCLYFCGMRATFEGVYFKPAPGCAAAEVTKGRAVFKRQFDQKAYAEARATLEQLLDRCAKTLFGNDADWMRNDLAITLYRLKDNAGCLRLLQPLAELGAMSEAKVREEYPPSDADMMVPIARATRTNLRLCKGGG
jgi:hypothetical protein